jgi:hypothetical protein
MPKEPDYFFEPSFWMYSLGNLTITDGSVGKFILVLNQREVRELKAVLAAAKKRGEP